MLAREHERVLILAADLPLVGNILGGLRHGVDAICRLHRRVDEAPAKRRVLDLLPAIESTGRLAHHERCAIHVLRATAIISSASPLRIACAALPTAFSPDPHGRLIVPQAPPRAAVLLPNGWLFPGRSYTDPISTRQLHRAVCEAEAAGIRRDVTIMGRNLPASFNGYRIIQLTDLHISRLFTAEWTQAVVERTNAAGADLTVVNGDFTTDQSTCVGPTSSRCGS